MADKKSVISIDVHGGTVTVDGRSLKCTMPEVASQYRAIHWDPSVPKWPGFAERANGEGQAFKDFAVLTPFVAAWKLAAKADDDTKAAAAAHAEAAERRRQAEEEAARAEHDAAVAAQQQAIEAAAPVNTALSGLAGSDYKIIKAMEAALLASGQIAPEIAAEREAWRETVRKAREQD